MSQTNLQIISPAGLGNIIDDEDAVRAPVVAGGYTLKPWCFFLQQNSKVYSTKPFLASGVPELELDLLPTAIYRFDLEVDPKGGREGGVEGSLLREAEEDAGLAHAGVAYQEQLEEKVVVLRLILHSHKTGLQ